MTSATEDEGLGLLNNPAGFRLRMVAYLADAAITIQRKLEDTSAGPISIGSVPDLTEAGLGN
jgi:hypothetical protein